MPTRDEEISIHAEGRYLAGTLVSPSTLIPGVLFVHGWGGGQDQYIARAREIAALGCVCLTFDLSGHADTLPMQETVSRENNLADVLAAYDTLVNQRGVDPSSIAVVGSSYGGYLAAILTTRRPVRWLALRSPALYMDSGWELPKLQLHQDQDLGSYRRRFVPAADNRALRACKAYRGDVLLIESEDDHIVPHAVINSYKEALMRPRSLTYRMISGADHGLADAASQRAYTALLVSWTNEMVQGARASTATQAQTPAGLPEAPPRPG
ncbi:MAG: alpha/beta fold hydrolase [Noviherbaspirillum sp.]